MNSDGYNLLIVEDEGLIRKNLIKKIEKLNMNVNIVGEAEDGDTALEFINKNPPSIVLTDIQMPCKNGIELSRELHILFPQIKIVIITGFSEFSYAQQAIAYNVKGFLLKPVSEIQLEQLFIKLILELDNETNNSSKKCLRPPTNLSKEDIANYIEMYILENFTKQISISDIADNIGFNIDYISHTFKKHKKISPIQFLTKLRINYAKQLLKNNLDIDIYTVGVMTGYSEQAYFSRVFKKHTGVYPSAFRSNSISKV